MLKNRVAIVAVAAVSSIVSATPEIGDYDSIRLQSTLGRFGGGEFRWGVGAGTPTDPGTGGSEVALGQFVSFCVELNESVSTSRDFRAVVNTGAIQGGVSSDTGTPDELDARTKALYEAFVVDASGLLGYTGSQNDAAAMQTVIWFLEGEMLDSNNVATLNASEAINPSSGNALTNNVSLANTIEARAQQFLDLAAGLIADGYGDRVRVLNLTRLDGSGNNQDMLYLIPLPQAGALAGLGLGGLAIRRRRA